jgi:integrase
VQKRIQGKEKRFTLARHGVLTVDQARREARKLLGQIAMGRDPIAEKAREKLQTITLREALEAYIKTRDLKPQTIQDMRLAFKGFHHWMGRPMTEITRDKVALRHRSLGERSQARANLAMRYLRAVFNFAMAEYTDAQGRPILPENPVNRLSQTRAWFRVERRRTVIKPHELKPWMQSVIMALENTTVRDYLMLVLLTGLRRTEAISLRWQDIDLKWRALTVEDTKNRRAHTLPLSDYLVQMLSERQAKATSDYVFEGTNGRLSNLRYAKAKVTGRSKVVFCIHDLRRTFATVADALDIPGYAVKALLNHTNANDVTAGYIVIDVERLRAPMQKITDYMLKAGGVRSGAAIAEIRQGAANE